MRGDTSTDRQSAGRRPVRTGQSPQPSRNASQSTQRIAWTPDGWPVLDGDTPAGHRDRALPRSVVVGPALPPSPVEPPPHRDRFGLPDLAAPWSTLRRHPDPSWLTLTERPGQLRLRGGQSLGSTHGQSLVARRQQAADFDFSVQLASDPRSPLQMGIVRYYNSTLWHYAHLTWDDEAGRVLRVGICTHGRYFEPAPPVPAPDGPVALRMSIRRARGHFAWRPAQHTEWQPIGPELDVTALSDENATQGDPTTGHFTSWGFTGAFAGMCAQDLTGAGLTADFAWAAYLEPSPDRHRAT